MLSVSVDVEVTLAVVPGAIALGKIDVGETIRRTVRLTGRLASGVALKGVGPTRLFDVTMLARKSGAEQQIDLAVTLKPSAAAGRRLHDTIELLTDRPDLGPVRLVISGYRLGNVTARPERVQLRAGANGDASKLELEVVAREGRPFKLLSIRDQHGRFDGRSTVVKAGHHYRVEAQVPAALLTRSFSGVLLVTTDDKDTPQLRVPYSVIAHRPPAAVPRRVRR